MSHWNYRIVKYADGDGYGLHEVHYDDNDKAYAITMEPAGFVCGEDEEPTEITEALFMALHDAVLKPVFEEPKEWK